MPSSSTIGRSRLETLPPELLDNILTYLLAPSYTDYSYPEHGFDTAILRVNKGLYRVARNFLHSTNRWIRVNVNWPRFIIDPDSLGVPCILIDSCCKKKMGLLQDSAHHILPNPSIYIRIKFPTHRTPEQIELRNRFLGCNSLMGGCAKSQMNILVHEKFLPQFLMCIRMTDLIYCKRIQPGQLMTDFQYSIFNTMNGCEGLYVDFQIDPELSPRNYVPTLQALKILDGLHDSIHWWIPGQSVTKVQVGAILEQITHYIVTQPASTDPDSIEKLHHFVELAQTTVQQRIVDRKPTLWEAVAHMLYLKFLGDRHYAMGTYARAAGSYKLFVTFSIFWERNDKGPWQGVPDEYQRLWDLHSSSFKAHIGTFQTLNICLTRLMDPTIMVPPVFYNPTSITEAILDSGVRGSHAISSKRSELYDILYVHNYMYNISNSSSYYSMLANLSKRWQALTHSKDYQPYPNHNSHPFGLVDPEGAPRSLDDAKRGLLDTFRTTEGSFKAAVKLALNARDIPVGLMDQGVLDFLPQVTVGPDGKYSPCVYQWFVPEWSLDKEGEAPQTRYLL